MNRMIVRSRVGADGTLNVTVPLGLADANRDVQLTIEPATNCIPSQEEWQAKLAPLAGCIDDPTFGRQEQGQFERREAFE